MKKGISLIVLVITIIVMIILAASVVITLSNTGIISNSSKAAFMQDIQAMQNQIALYMVDAPYNVYATKDVLKHNGVVVENKTILDIIPSLDENNINDFIIENGKLKYIGDSVEKLTWTDEVLNGTKNVALKETTTTIGNIKLENTAAMQLAGLKIYGNNIQAGTPTPDAPIEIQSVGDRTSNMIIYPYEDTTVERYGIKYNDNGDGGITVSGTTEKFAIFNLMKNGLVLEAGETYYIKADGIYSNVSVILAYTDGDGVINWRGKGQSIEWKEEYTNPTFYLQVNPGFTVSGTIYPYLVDKENKDDSFGLYGKYKIPVKITGKNLMPYSIHQPVKESMGIKWINNNDGTIGIKGTTTGFSMSVFLEGELLDNLLEDGKTYTMSVVQVSGDIPEQFRILAEVRHKGTTNVAKYIDVYNNQSATFTVNKELYDYAYVRLQIPNEGITADGNIAIQLEEGNEATNYVPYETITNIYLDEPLRKVGSYTDYIDLRANKVVRNVRSLTFNISDMDNYEEYPGWQVDIIKNDYPSINNIIGAYTAITTNISNNNHSIGINTLNTSVMFLRKEIFNLTQTEWKTNYSDLNVEICYGLQKAEVEELNLPDIQMNNGYSVLSIETQLKPSNVELKYYENK